MGRGWGATLGIELTPSNRGPGASVAKASGLRTVLVVGKEKLCHLDRPGTVDAFVLAPEGDANVGNQAIVEIQAGFDLMFVHFPDTDMATPCRWSKTVLAG
jgi:hypothetical protein